MAKWHLVAPDGGIVRTADADTLGEARWRLRPILGGHSVLSSLSYRNAPRTPTKRKNPSKVRDISGSHRMAIAAANTRRMYERRGWYAPNPEVVHRKNVKYYQKVTAADPNYLARRRISRREATVTKYDAIAGRIIGLVMERKTDREIAALCGVSEQVVLDLRHHYAVPSVSDMEKTRRTALLWYYRLVRGWSLMRVSEHTGICRKYLRTLKLPSTLQEIGHGQ